MAPSTKLLAIVVLAAMAVQARPATPPRGFDWPVADLAVSARRARLAPQMHPDPRRPRVWDHDLRAVSQA
jgi:hypothetical protein